MFDSEQPRSSPTRWNRGALAAICCLAAIGASAHLNAQAGAGDDEVGMKLFTSVAQPPCSLCHVLAAAGASGKIGPSLDELKPDADRVARAVKQGVGVMPAFDESLTDEQIGQLARYVARASGASK